VIAAQSCQDDLATNLDVIVLDPNGNIMPGSWSTSLRNNYELAPEDTQVDGGLLLPYTGDYTIAVLNMSFDEAENHLGVAWVKLPPQPTLGAIGGTVWYDYIDPYGVRTSDEEVAPGEPIEVYRDNGDAMFDTASDTLVATTVTNVDGRYLIQDLPAGSYWIWATDTSYLFQLVTLSGGQYVLDVDLGIVGCC
jgi:hypothetical protein